jgi:hypothetical protein
MAERFRYHWAALAILAFAYGLLFAWYYPATHGIEDEVGFINQALVWSRGAFSAEGAGFESLQDFVGSGGHHIAWRNPGRSLLILPFLVLGGYEAIFWSGMIIHLGMTFLAGLTLQKLHRSPLLALLVLFHPTLSLYSRTIMGDAPAGLFLLLAFYCIVGLKRPGLWAGLAVGAAAVMRYQAGIVLPFVAAAIGLTPSIAGRKREAVLCLASGGAVGLLIALYNQRLYGNVLGVTFQGFFSACFVGDNLEFYLLALTLIWPLMALAPLLDRCAFRWPARAICLPFLAFLLPYFFYDKGSSWLQTAVLGQRLLQPVLPVWIVSYAVVLDSVLKRWVAAWHSPSRQLIALTCLGVSLLALQGAAFRRHSAHLEQMLAAREQVSKHVPAESLLVANSTLVKLFGVPVSGIPQYRLLKFSNDGQGLEPADESARAETREWFLAYLRKSGSGELPAPVRDLVKRHHMTRLETEHTDLYLFRCSPPGKPARLNHDRN